MNSMIIKTITAPLEAIYQGALDKEINRPLETDLTPMEKRPKHTDGTINYITNQRLSTPRELIIFFACTGFNLNKVRLAKNLFSPKFEKLVEKSITLPKGEEKTILEFEKKMLRMEVTLDNCSVESYWVNRELSIKIDDLYPLKEKLSNDRSQLCDDDKKYNNALLQEIFPVESAFAQRTISRLTNPKPLREITDIPLAMDYNKETDTFKLVEHGEGFIPKLFKSRCPENNIDLIANTHLKKRLDKDFENRKIDPKSKLEFVKNDLYEERIRGDKFKLFISWVSTIAFSVLTLVASCFLGPKCAKIIKALPIPRYRGPLYTAAIAVAFFSIAVPYALSSIAGPYSFFSIAVTPSLGFNRSPRIYV